MPNPSHDEIKQDLLSNLRYAETLAPYHPEAEEPQWRSTLGKHMRESLLDGRELLGEPRNFDF